MNWSYTDCNSSRQIPRDICILFIKLKKNFFSFLFLKFFLFYFLLKFPTTPPLLFNFHFHIFLWCFLLGKFFFFYYSSFFFFFSFLFLFFFFLVFLSYFLLKFTNTPLLFLNFYFHFIITLKKKREREALFLNWTSYIFLNFGFLNISKSLTSTLNF